MHKHKTKMDAGMTALYRKKGWFVSRHSYVSHRIHPGTERQCFYAAGRDCGWLRQSVLDQAAGRCEECGMWTRKLEVHHKAHKTKMERCWCRENLQALCVQCHRGSRGKHVQVRWTDRREQAIQDFEKVMEGEVEHERRS